MMKKEIIDPQGQITSIEEIEVKYWRYGSVSGYVLFIRNYYPFLDEVKIYNFI